MTDLERAAALLQSADAGGLLLAALTGDPAAALPGFASHLTTWQYRPGAEVTAGYSVAYPDPSGRMVHDELFVTTAGVPAPATLSRDGLDFAVWRHPGDPLLPGLAPACDPTTVMGWLHTSPNDFDLTLLGYRPLRRAVLRATADDDLTYLKVLRPERADRLAVRQELLADAGLTPPLRARPAPGVLVTPAASGRSLAHVLASPGDPELPTPDDLVALLDELPQPLLDLPRRPAWADRLDFHTATAVDRLPEQTRRLRALQRRLQPVLDTAPVGPIVPTHGDFYEANLMVSGSQLTLIDLDACGPGRREDDLACMLAHLAVLPGLSPEHYQEVPAILSRWTDAFASRVAPAALLARVAAVVLSLVAGADADQAEHRLEIAEAWAERSLVEGGGGPS
jgi:hypothetical protein